ncbi:hypothetical protein GHU05_01320 [Fructobacillus tropaeoli]|uniref:P-loop NTPase fold protein n=1 Tax=Fructobacillus tropaeoli TaxID=709323 RepID=UPI001455E439|nr:P-loop NTPase fold protein [Fructobacillus tropaeoli]NLS37573.1 hypothetical protein [Fructobacillus tropaeoli]
MTQQTINPIKLKNIDVSAEADFIANLISEHKMTFFLNGKWGSGKTSFLREVQNKLKKKVTLKYLDLWRIKDSNSVISSALRLLKPFHFWTGRILFLIALFIVIVVLGKLQVGFLNYLFNFLTIKSSNIGVTILQLIVAVSAFSVFVFEFFKLKTDRIDLFLLTKGKIKKKILIVDDFDRLTADQQNETYKLFSLLKGRVSIIFVGDYQRIVKQNIKKSAHEEDTYKVSENYLVKIIDKRLELPRSLATINIWDEYFSDVSRNLKISYPSTLRNLAISEGRTLRDREQFNNYFNQVFVFQRKYGRVSSREQLIIIYIYLFHSKIYDEIVNGTYDEKNYSDSQEPFDNFNGKYSINRMVKDLFEAIPGLKDPRDIASNQYFIYENPTGLSEFEFLKIINNKEFLANRIRHDDNDALLQQLRDNYAVLNYDNREKLQEAALAAFKQGVRNNIVYVILRDFKQNCKNLISNEQITEKKILNVMRKVLEDNGYDFSEQILFLQFFSFWSIEKLSPLVGEELGESILKTSSFRHPVYVLLSYLSLNHVYGKPEEWSEAVFNAANQLSVDEFIFFAQQGKILMDEHLKSWYGVKTQYPKALGENEYYLIAYVKQDDGQILDNRLTLKKLDVALNNLRASGITLIDVDQEGKK